ncbi:hypothetical protein GGI25_003892 [Coemansia spiralis]|uniref:Uncharacterized protein n=1 Tax=Coemansia spiralis TaxID=417178 RepID=A0A9W8G1A6_9FUNG|nr:hypothetical protein GGI25_003892 [Coemansia spiralis]
MPITTANSQEEFDKLIQRHEVVLVLFCAKFTVPIPVMKAFGRLSLKIPEYRFCYIDLKDHPDISSRVRISGSYVISVYRSGGLATTFTVADMEFYTNLETMDKGQLDMFVERAINNANGGSARPLAQSSLAPPLAAPAPATQPAVVLPPVQDASRTVPAESSTVAQPTISNTALPHIDMPLPHINDTASRSVGSASISVRADNYQSALPQVTYPASHTQPPHMATYNASVLPPQPMYIYQNPHFPQPHTTTYGGGYSSGINISQSSSATDSSHLVGTHLSELIAVKVAEKISRQGGLPPSGSVKILVNIDVNVSFQ